MPAEKFERESNKAYLRVRLLSASVSIRFNWCNSCTWFSTLATALEKVERTLHGRYHILGAHAHSSFGEVLVEEADECALLRIVA
jgi:hypothetical protein